MEEHYQRAFKLSFTYGYGCCVFKHDICGDQPEVPYCMLDSPNFLSPKCFVSLRCPHVSTSSKDANVGVHRREVAEELERGAPVGDLNGTSLVPLFLLLSTISIVVPIWSLGHILSCN